MCWLRVGRDCVRAPASTLHATALIAFKMSLPHAAYNLQLLITKLPKEKAYW